MVALWQRMTDYFGPQWQASYGTIDEGTIYSWTGALMCYTENEIAGAVKACQSWDGSFPPNFGQFKALVMAARSAANPNYTEKRIAVEKQTGQSVTMIEHLSRSATSDVAKKELDRMKRILAGEDVESRETSYHNLGLGFRWPGAV